MGTSSSVSVDTRRVETLAQQLAVSADTARALRHEINVNRSQLIDNDTMWKGKVCALQQQVKVFQQQITETEADNGSSRRGEFQKELKLAKSAKELDAERLSERLLKEHQQIVPRVVVTLPKTNLVRGVTSLDDELYVLYENYGDEIQVFVRTTKTTMMAKFSGLHIEQIEVSETKYSLIDRLFVSEVESRSLCDIASCKHYRCLYVADCDNCCVHRVELNGEVTKLSVNNPPISLSVTSQFTVLVTCCGRKLLELTTEGKQLREITLQPDIDSGSLHAIQLSNSQFVVCHGYSYDDDPVHRVCIVDTNGHVTQSYGGPPGSATVGQLNEPSHLAVDKDGFIFVADSNNRRVLLLSPTLSLVREIVSRDQLKWTPQRLFLDVDRRLLYVADCDTDLLFGSGQVVVFQL